MNELTKELKDIIIREIKRRYFHCIVLPSDIDKANSKSQWIRLLRNLKWEKDSNTNSKQIRFLNNLNLFQCSISVKYEPTLLGIYGIVFSDRYNIVTRELNHKAYDNMSKYPSDFDYVINEGNLEKALSELSMEPKCFLPGKCLIDFSVSTLTGDKIPDCSECKGEGECFCPICKGKGKVRCRDCKGRGWLMCEKCGGIGEIQYEAGNYANGELRIKTKACPICEGQGKLKCNNCNGEGEVACKECNGKGKLTCRKCHGSGKKVNSSVIQTIKSFEDRYYFQKGMSFVIKSNDVNNASRFFPIIKSFSHKYLRISRMYQASGQIIIDNKAQIANEVFSSGDELLPLYDAIQKDIETLWRKRKAVCVLENYFTTLPITIISMQYSDLDGGNNAIEFYVWENLIWCNCSEELSFWKLLSLKIKKVIS